MGNEMWTREWPLVLTSMSEYMSWLSGCTQCSRVDNKHFLAKRNLHTHGNGQSRQVPKCTGVDISIMAFLYNQANIHTHVHTSVVLV